jgi:hypothetical protein
MRDLGNNSDDYEYQNSNEGVGEEGIELCYHTWENLVNSDESTIICVNCGEEWGINDADSNIIGVLWQASREAIECLSDNVSELRSLISLKLSLEPCSVCGEYIDKENPDNLQLKFGACCLECLPLVIGEASPEGLVDVKKWAEGNGLLESDEITKQILWLKLQTLQPNLKDSNISISDSNITIPMEQYGFLGLETSVTIGSLSKSIAKIFDTEQPKTEISEIFLVELFSMTLELYSYADSPLLLEKIAESIKDGVCYPENQIDLIISDLLDGSGASSNILGMDLFNMVIESGVEKLVQILREEEKIES